MKDFTTTSFGLVIAYLLPGLVTLFGVSAWSQRVRMVFGSLFTAQVDGGLLVSVGACALVIGLVINVVRWLVFERLICRMYTVAPKIFSKSSSTSQLQSFLMIIEETFRYHQFYGSMTILTPFLYLSWLRFFESNLLQDSVFLWMTSLFIAAEYFLSWLSYEKRCGSAGAAWVDALYQYKYTQAGIYVLRGIVLFLYLLAFGYHFGGFAGRYALLAVTTVFTFGGIVIGANAMAAQRRYSERAKSLAGG